MIRRLVPFLLALAIVGTLAVAIAQAHARPHTPAAVTLERNLLAHPPRVFLDPLTWLPDNGTAALCLHVVGHVFSCVMAHDYTVRTLMVTAP